MEVNNLRNMGENIMPVFLSRELTVSLFAELDKMPFSCESEVIRVMDMIVQVEPGVTPGRSLLHI